MFAGITVRSGGGFLGAECFFMGCLRIGGKVCWWRALDIDFLLPMGFDGWLAAVEGISMTGRVTLGLLAMVRWGYCDRLRAWGQKPLPRAQRHVRSRCSTGSDGCFRYNVATSSSAILSFQIPILNTDKFRNRHLSSFPLTSHSRYWSVKC